MKFSNLQPFHGATVVWENISVISVTIVALLAALGWSIPKADPDQGSFELKSLGSLK